MKQPLTSIAAVLAGGIWVGRFIDLSIPLLIAIGLLSCIVALNCDSARRWLMPAIVFIAGAANIAVHHQIVSPVDLRKSANDSPRLVSIQGKVRSTVQKRPLDGDDERPDRYSVVLDVHHLRNEGKEWTQVHGMVIASLEFAGAERVFPGQTIELFGILSAPPGPFAPGMFDYRKHLANRGIHFLFKSEEPADLSILKSVGTPLTIGFRKWATQALTNGFTADDRSIQLLRAMCLGWRTALTDEVSEPFMKSGTMHLFAVSGLHVALIAGILTALFRAIRLDQKWCGLAVIPLLWFFTAATGWQSSAIRSTIMMSVILLAWSLRRPTNLLNTLSVAAIIILLWDPKQLFQAGFQLSFAVVGTIALFVPRLESWIPESFFSDPFLPVELQPKWRQWLDRVAKFGFTAFGISLAAWLGSLPLIMVYFNLFTPGSLLANVIVVQLGAGALASATGCLLTAPFIPIVSELFGNSAWFLMSCMSLASEWFGRLPLAWAYVQAPAGYVIAAYYVGLVAALITSARLSRSVRFWVVAAALAIVITGTVAQRLQPPTMALLPLGAGYSVFVDKAADENWLIDCGDSSNYRFHTREYLRTRGVNRIDNFFVTHGDTRHMGGATNLIAEFRPRQIYLNPIRQRSVSYRQLLAFMETNRLVANAFSSDADSGPWRVLHPQPNDSFQRADGGTMVLLFANLERTILLCNDLNSEGQKIFAERHPELHADTVVISPNSDRKTPHSSWLKLFNPDAVIVADSDVPTSNRTSTGQRKSLREALRNVRFLSDDGVVQIPLDVAGP